MLEVRALKVSYGLRDRLAVDLGGEDEFVAALHLGQQTVELHVVLLRSPQHQPIGKCIYFSIGGTTGYNVPEKLELVQEQRLAEDRS